jgi:hypothetical protein
MMSTLICFFDTFKISLHTLFTIQYYIDDMLQQCTDLYLDAVIYTAVFFVTSHQCINLIDLLNRR